VKITAALTLEAARPALFWTLITRSTMLHYTYQSSAQLLSNARLRLIAIHPFGSAFYKGRCYSLLFADMSGPNCIKYGQSIDQSSALQSLFYVSDILLFFDTRSTQRRQRLQIEAKISPPKIFDVWVIFLIPTYDQTYDVYTFDWNTAAVW